MQLLSHGWRRAAAAVATLVAGYLAGVSAAPVRAADVAEFYRGKTITVVIGYSAGGGYDVFARLLAQHMGRHIPGNPVLVPQNMPGAGSRKAGMFLYEVAAKDGTIIGTIGRNEPIAPLIEQDVKFDGTKFGWIGSITDDDSICVSWQTSPVKTWQDMQTRPFTVGALAPGDNTVTVALALKNLFGANIRLVKGYPGTTDLFLALERGEIEGACGVSWRPILTQHRDWIAGRKINVLVEVALARDPSLGEVPLITQFVHDPEQLQILSLLIASQAMARPFLAPPGIPEDRKQALRTAFDQTMTDPQFLADAEKAALSVHAMTGSEIDALLKTLYATPKELAAEAARAIQN
jgi:tripartite-type tricarboxylate transporter receptor subunit TctC